MYLIPAFPRKSSSCRYDNRFGRLRRLPGTNVSEDSKVAFYLSLLGGVIYAEILVWVLGVWMASPMVHLWVHIDSFSSLAILYVDGILISILCFVFLVLPLAYVLRFLFSDEAKLAASAVALGAFLYLYVPDPLSLWILLRSHTALVTIQHLVFFGGPAFAVWMISRVQNRRLASA